VRVSPRATPPSGRRRLVIGSCLLSLAIAGGAGLAQAGDASTVHGVVLGSKYWLSSVGGGGRGWGTSRPKSIDNGGDPSGIVNKIRWSTWGGKAAIGYGLTWVNKPTGGYYATQARIELKALNIGLCYPKGPRAYRKLAYRAAARPGGPLGAWYLWGGQKTLCKWQ